MMEALDIGVGGCRRGRRGAEALALLEITLFDAGVADWA